MAELEMTESRSQALVGSATIFIRHLQFPQDGEVRALDEKNVQRLLEIFEIAGCENVDKDKHHIPAVVPRLQLEYILHQNGRHISQLQDLKPPKLLLDHDAALECLHGRHRLAAARRYLPPNESWWVVDLYVAEGMIHP